MEVKMEMIKKVELNGANVTYLKQCPNQETYINDACDAFKGFVHARYMAMFDLLPKGVVKKIINGKYKIVQTIPDDMIEIRTTDWDNIILYKVEKFLCKLTAFTKKDIIKVKR